MTDYSKLARVLAWHSMFTDGPLSNALRDAASALERASDDAFDAGVYRELEALQMMFR
jgi:hypothetical protein